MATGKTNKRNRQSASSGTTDYAAAGKSGADSTSILARTGRTIKEQPYTSAAIATGAVTAVVAAGAFFFSRRDQSDVANGETMTAKVKGSFAEARARIKELVGRDESSHQGDGRSQQQIAEEALTLKETGASALDETSASDIRTGAIAY